MTPLPTCARCGAPLASADAACPRCLMSLGSGPASAPPRAAHAGRVPELAELQPLFPGLELQGVLGRGGMGVVYRARQRDLDRVVALKVLLPECTADPAFAERFEREARVLARLDHPGVVRVVDAGRTGTWYWLVMEYVDGVNLRKLIEEREVAPREALAIVTQVCDALQYAHDQGVVHRDIKPENILVDRLGRVKIADFGLAKLVEREAGAVTLTRSDQAMGTPQYMAPEQIRRPLAVDHRADLYSLGVVLYELLTGDLPLGNFPLPSDRVGIDVRLDEVVLKSLEREPERRYQHASEVKVDVERASQPDAGGGARARRGEAGDEAWRDLARAAKRVRDEHGETFRSAWHEVKRDLKAAARDTRRKRRDARHAERAERRRTRRSWSGGAWAATGLGCCGLIAMLLVGFVLLWGVRSQFAANEAEQRNQAAVARLEAERARDQAQRGHVHSDGSVAAQRLAQRDRVEAPQLVEGPLPPLVQRVRGFVQAGEYFDAERFAEFEREVGARYRAAEDACVSLTVKHGDALVLNLDPFPKQELRQLEDDLRARLALAAPQLSDAEVEEVGRRLMPYGWCRVELELARAAAGWRWQERYYDDAGQVVWSVERTTAALPPRLARFGAQLAQDF
ncbi:MAG: serine/threonine protein kinase [Planctomycetes bacterium]|nr:serine/threonine protein kinase [Planctomycetota bacterium]